MLILLVQGLGLDYYQAHWYDYMAGGIYCMRCNSRAHRSTSSTTAATIASTVTAPAIHLRKREAPPSASTAPWTPGHPSRW